LGCRGRKIKENMLLHKKQKDISEFGKRVKVLRPAHQGSSTAATIATAGHQGSPSVVISKTLLAHLLFFHIVKYVSLVGNYSLLLKT